MGTNFFWLGRGESVDPEVHIGKRSAAGLWCWDCDETLVVGGKSQIHKSNTAPLDACPKCGKAFVRAEDGLRRGPIAVELGFAAPEIARPTGVAGCSSFTWAQDPETVGVLCRERADEEIIVDEYGRKLTGEAFVRMLECNCPVQFTELIGHWFS